MAEMDAKQEKTWGMFCHLSALAGYFIPLGNIVGPLVLWLIKKNESSLVDAEGRKALNFQISVTIYAIVALLLMVIVIGVILLPVIGIFNLIMVIVAAVKTNNAEDFKYPLSISFLK